MGIADPSIWDGSRGPSIADKMAAEKVYWTKADNERIAGKMQVHSRLMFRPDGVPMLQAFKDCEAFRRIIPAMNYDLIKVEDVDSSSEDHVYDEVRYMCMQFPINAYKPVKVRMKYFNPLED